jgi:putative N6-adenine-specific DNA methylase
LFDLIATATFGLEAVVARELKALGYDVKVKDSKVEFRGDARALCRANLWLRSADRVLVKMGEFEALTFDELFEKTKALPWEDILPEDACFPVLGKSVKSTLFSISDCQAIVKKAIVERLKTKYKKSWFEESGSKYTIEVRLLRDVATLTIDTSGMGLHKRGYRELAGDAPLKETLAAALVQLSFWDTQRPLIDPFCGTGTILIEAALIGLNIAPGLNRRFDSMKWPQVPERLWADAISEAREAIKNVDLRLLGHDIDDRALDTARICSMKAGVNKYIDFHRLPVAQLSSKRKYGCIICNPPYGERMGEAAEAEKLYRLMGEVFSKLDTWSFYVLTSNEGFEKLFGRKCDRKRKLYNGRIKVDYYQFHGPRPPRRSNDTERNDAHDVVYKEEQDL